MFSDLPQSPSTISMTVANVDDEPTVSCQVTIPASMRDEFVIAVREMVYGRRPRRQLLEARREAIANTGMQGLHTLHAALNRTRGPVSAGLLPGFLPLCTTATSTRSTSPI